MHTTLLDSMNKICNLSFTANYVEHALLHCVTNAIKVTLRDSAWRSVRQVTWNAVSQTTFNRVDMVTHSKLKQYE